jgi:hypothetical protein
VKNAALPDNGALNIPKLFRRQATFWAQLPGPLTPAEFKAKIDLGLTGKTDKAYRLHYFPRPHRQARPQEAHPAGEPHRRPGAGAVRSARSGLRRGSLHAARRQRQADQELDVSGKGAGLT